MDWGASLYRYSSSGCVGTFVMGTCCKYPVALAPGMGLNAHFSFAAVLGMGISWQTHYLVFSFLVLF